jgi:hypothetical protein
VIEVSSCPLSRRKNKALWTICQVHERSIHQCSGLAEAEHGFTPLESLIISEPGMETPSLLYHWKVCICQMESAHRVSTLKHSRGVFSAVQFSGLVKGDFGQWRGERNRRSRCCGSAERGTQDLVIFLYGSRSVRGQLLWNL